MKQETTSIEYNPFLKKSSLTLPVDLLHDPLHGVLQALSCFSTINLYKINMDVYVFRYQYYGMLYAMLVI